MAEKPKYHPTLYLSTGISGKKLDKIKHKLNKHPLRAGVYLIATARGGDLLEIYGSEMLAQRYFRRNPPYIVGIADNYEEAVRLVEQMVQDCLDSRGDCALREYLSC